MKKFTKMVFASLVVTVLICRAGAACCEELDLAGEWRLSGTDEQGHPVGCPIAVPGGVHTALRKAGKMPDSFWGCNETNIQWVGRHDWTVSRTFTVGPEILERKAIVLRLDNVDLFATITVNGREIGRTDNRFRRWEFDLKPYLKSGENEISGRFESAELKAGEVAKLYDRRFDMGDVRWAKNHAYVRKPACHAGWDWGIAQMITGFCGETRILAYDDFKLDYVRADQSFNADFSHCDLTVYADATDADGAAFTVTNRYAIDNPPLWWPNGAGERRFYDYNFEIRGRTFGGRIGLRKIELLTDRDAEGSGSRMAFRVNGRELFMKGANWIPCSAYENEQTPERYRDLLESAAAANMNMLRVWGGGQYEKDCFYDLCDELGILVWQDMMFACATYPGSERFLGPVREELRHQIRRLQTHASVALWCGDNECLSAMGWYPASKADPDYYKGETVKRHRACAEMVRRYDPARAFWPSSPCAGPGDLAYGGPSNERGDIHNWYVWFCGLPFSDFNRTRPRFVSEYGFQSYPSREVAETFCGEKGVDPSSPVFDWHQKNDGGNKRIREAMHRYLGVAKDADSELILSQFLQGLAIRTATESWRSQRPRCMGTLYWQLNDDWPVSSWSSIEYGGKWKPLHYLVKRMYAPIAVAAQPTVTGDRVDVTRGSVIALNDTDSPVKGTLHLEYWSYDGQVVGREKKDVTLPPDSATPVAAFAKRDRFDTHPDAFLEMTLVTERGRCRNDWHFGTLKDQPLARAHVTAKTKTEGDVTTVELTTDRPAFYVWANVPGVRGEFDDNCLTLLPGRPQTIRFAAKGAGPVRPTVTHLRELLADPTDDVAYLRRKFRQDMTDEGTGLDLKALKAGSQKIADTWCDKEPWASVKARLFAYICDNMAIGVSTNDYFPAFACWSRLDRPLANVIYGQMLHVDATTGADAARARREWLKTGNGYIHHDYDHAAPDWEAALRLGFPGLRARAAAAPVTNDFSRAMLSAADAMLRTLARLERHAAASPHADHPRIRGEIAALRALQAGPPRTTYEVLLFQQLFFVFGEQIDCLQVRTLGNLDKLLTPYYRADLAAGRITEAEFRELLRHFWWQWGSLDNWWGQPVYIGGTAKDGSSNYNEVSRIILDVHDELALPTPKMQMKMADNTPDWVWRKSLDMVRRHRSIVFCGEEPMYRALRSLGFSEEESRDVEIWGCYEFQPRAKANATIPSILNVVRPLHVMMEEVLERKADYPPFESFRDAYLAALSRNSARACEVVAEYEKTMDEFIPALVHSLTIGNCVRRGRNALGTGMEHNLTLMLQCGLGTVVDSLLGLKEVVYERKLMGLRDFCGVLATNWKGQEELRLRMARSPRKWGNGDAEANALCRDVLHAFGGPVNGRRNSRGGIFMAGGHSINYFHPWGWIRATPDGRRQGDELSKNISPAPGADRSGMTATINGIGAIDCTDIPGDVILDEMVHPSQVAGEKGLEVLRTAVSVYFRNGGCAIHFNVFDVETLRDAQAHPEKYENLQVRVCGWNVRWNDLTKSEQEGYIRRAEAVPRD